MIYLFFKNERWIELNKTNYEKAVRLRHELHQHPELSNNEVWTKEHLINFLKDNTSLKIVDKGSWFYALYFVGNGKKNIAFRADFDAIPVDETLDLPYKSQNQGVAHKCGHDGHSATLAALAMEVEHTGADKNIYFIFQHAEETGDGAKCCSELIKEAHIDEVFAFHNLPGFKENTVALRSGTLCCASKGMEIAFTGVSAHASEPEKGKNPAFAIANIITSIPSLIVPEEHNGIILCTVVQVDIGERAFGVSAHKGKLLLTIRAEDENELKSLQYNLENLAKEQGIIYGLDLSIQYHDDFPETANHKESVDKIKKVANGLGFPIYNMPQPIRTSEDFGYFLKETKGAMFWLGDGENQPPLHSAEFDFPDKIISSAVSIFLGLINM
jgi:amidohydrolase